MKFMLIFLSNIALRVATGSSSRCSCFGSRQPKLTDFLNNEVTKGLVIQDEHGNQFVWIPIGDVKKSDGTIKRGNQWNSIK